MRATPRVDVLLLDQNGQQLGRPWLTTVIDTYSRCIMGINLGFDAPSSQVVAKAIAPCDFTQTIQARIWTAL